MRSTTRYWRINQRYILKKIRAIHLNCVEVNQDFLETCIPRTGDSVMIVLTKERHLVGQLGKILEKNHDKEKAVIQLESNFEVLVRIPSFFRSFING